MRFYGDPTKTATVVWSFVDEATPFIPYPTVFNSRTWDDDFWRGTDRGEVPGATRAYYKGTPLGLYPPVAVPCGTADQFLNGQAYPPVTPVPTDPNGSPLCCGGALSAGLLYWMRASELAGLTDGDPLTTWPAPRPELPPGFGALGFEPRISQPGVEFFTHGGIAHPPIAGSASVMQWLNPSQAGDFTTALCCWVKPATNLQPILTAALPAPYQLPGLTRTSQFARVNPDTAGVNVPPPTDGPHLWICRRTGPVLEIFRDGSLLGSVNGTAGTLWQSATLVAPGQVPDALGTVQVFELAAWARALSAEEMASYLNLLRLQYGIP